jgi:SAM-dependent methyltransferase
MDFSDWAIIKTYLGISYRSEFLRVMERLQEAGVHYPDNYLADLLRKYRGRRVRYPKILQRLGAPNIRKHFAYNRVLASPGTFLDYGCGTGDDIRAIVKDGFPLELITGYDVNENSVQLGFDFYLDRELLQQRIVISPEFPFSPESFDIVYSGSVLHVLHSREKIEHYLVNAFAVLKANGMLFGSTLGSNHGSRLLRKKLVFRLNPDALDAILGGLGFTDIEIQTYEKEQHERLWFYARKP